MASAGTLNVSIVADTRRFTKGMKGAQAQVAAFGKATDAAGRYVRALASGLAAYGSMRAISATASELDKLAKTAGRLGIATEQLAGLNLAASQTGVNTATLNMALQRMVRRISEAAKGTGEAKAAIAELGLEAKALAQLSPDKQFRQIAGAMEGVATQGDRVRLAMKLFDSEGVALVQTLKLGSRGLDEMQREAERLGIAFSGAELAKVEAMNDAMDKLKRAIGGVGSQLVIDIAPAATRAVELLADTLSMATGRSAAMRSLNGTGRNLTGAITGAGQRASGARVAQRYRNWLIDSMAKPSLPGASQASINRMMAKAAAPMQRAGQQILGRLGNRAAGAATSAIDSLKLQQRLESLGGLLERLSSAGAAANKTAWLFSMFGAKGAAGKAAAPQAAGMSGYRAPNVALEKGSREAMIAARSYGRDSPLEKVEVATTKTADGVWKLVDVIEKAMPTVASLFAPAGGA